MLYFAISALGTDQPGIVGKLTKLILNNGCNIADSRMTVLGGEFAMLMLVNGNWNNIAKLEDALPILAKELGLSITGKRTEPQQKETRLIPYLVEAVAIDHPGIVHHLSSFFSQQNINIDEVYTQSYPAPHTGTPMFSLSMTIELPASIQISKLREEFLTICDELNLDALIEPVKN